MQVKIQRHRFRHAADGAGESHKLFEHVSASAAYVRVVWSRPGTPSSRPFAYCLHGCDGNAYLGPSEYGTDDEALYNHVISSQGEPTQYVVDRL